MKKTKNTKKLKIAVQLFGNLRTFNQCAPILKKELLNHYDCDVFMHTWDTIDHDNITWHDYKVSQPKDLTHEEIEKKVRSYYDLKDFKVEKQVDEDYGNVLAITREISLCGMKAMMHSMKSANDMREKYQKENKVKYDFVVVLRPDVFLNRKLDINEFLERMTEEEINNSLFTGGLPSLSLLSHFKYLVATDVLFFAKPEIISKQCKTFDKAFKAMQSKSKIPFGPEYYIVKEVENLGITPIFINMQMGTDFEIRRGTDQKRKTKSLRKKIIRLHIRKNYFKLHLLSSMKTRIIRFRIEFSGIYRFDIALGRVKQN